MEPTLSPAPAIPPVPPRERLLTALVTLLIVIGVVLAVLRPAWLTEPLTAWVTDAGWAAPLAFVLACALTAPLHLNGVLVTLSSVLWPLPEALALSFVGSLIGNVLTFALLSQAGGGLLRWRTRWPAWLERLASGVRQRPVLIGVIARLALGSGVALEAFFVLTRYTRRQYLGVALLGTALWTAQALLGVTALHALAQVSPLLAGLFALVPLLMVGALVALRRRR